ncbi:hypothetical protein [Rhizobium sp. BK176]|uniref:hypothetical protein n=1 Tax=Rhizobium sp. BK176 TaxID=2587071 RepID=UPI002167DA53|nr:hypothetical protein [Rhizobium sp. BK176]MCS4089861.1 Ca2+-binding RTX toxin-like protein [Rhizobium sp. BK176]
MTLALTEVQLTAALAEEVYRRSTDGANGTDDVGITLAELNVSSVTSLSADGLVRDDRGLGLYYADNGFCGQVVEAENTVYVIFRGTDAASSFKWGSYQALVNGSISDQTAQSSDHTFDLGDLYTDVALGKGSVGFTQLDYALSLAQKAVEFADATGKTVKVVGQSLGGGLAGLVGAVMDLKSFLVAPAPFQAQLNIEATFKALAEYGIARGEVGHWEGGVLFYVFQTGEYLEAALKNNLDWDEGKIADFIALRNQYIAQFQTNLSLNTTINTIEGEMLSDGAGGILGTKFDVPRTQYDLGVEPSITGGLTDNTSVSLHSPTLHALVLLAESTDHKFSELSRNDVYLRNGLFEHPEISGPIEGNRADYGMEGIGGSGLPSSGAGTHILYRVLWKSLVNQDGFYEKFYKSFGDDLKDGAVSQSSLTPYSSTALLHSGFVNLGLETVRDAIARDGTGSVSQAAWHLFERDGLANGVAVDLRNISELTAIDGVTLGKAELDQAFQYYVADVLSPSQANDWGLTWASKIDLNWTVAVAQSGNGTLRYGMSAEGLLLQQDEQSLNHIVFGGSGDDRIRTSNGKDYIYGGDGDDIIEGGSGADLIVGGAHSTLGDTVSYRGSRAAVDIHLGDVVQIGGDAEGDLLVGIENVVGSDWNDKLRGDTGVNWLYGGKGNDRFFIDGDGSAGSGDHFIGGDGIDTLDLSAASEQDDPVDTRNGYVVDLGRGSVKWHDGEATLLEIENILGSSYDDDITGDAGSNSMYGGAGSDRIDGGTGWDIALFKGIDGQALSFGFSRTGEDLFMVAAADGTDNIRNVEVFQFGASADTVTFSATTSSVLPATRIVDFGWGDDVANITTDLGLVYFGNVGFDTINFTSTIGFVAVHIASYTAALASVFKDIMIDIGSFVLSGTGSSGTFYAAGFENVFGTANDDKLYFDFIPTQAASGTMVFDAGDGNDIIDLSGLSTGVSISGSIQAGLIINGVTLSLKNFEGLTATQFNDTLSLLTPGSINALGGNDVIYGTAGNDIADGGSGNDRMYLAGGNDRVLFSFGLDYVEKTGGKLTIDYTLASQAMVFRYDNDWAKAWTGAVGFERLKGANEYEFLGSNLKDDVRGWGYYGVLTLIGGGGDDWLESGNASSSRLEGGAGNDYLRGGAGNDYILGGDGDDRMSGGGGFDRLDFGSGNNTLFVGDSFGDSGFLDINLLDRKVYEYLNAATYFSGGQYDSFDTFEGSLSGVQIGERYQMKGLQVRVTGTEANETYTGFGGREVVYMGGGSDTVFLNGQDEAHGGSGNDVFDGTLENPNASVDGRRSVFYGDDGNDTFTLSYDFAYGGAGDDMFSGGADSHVWGGEGNDTFNGSLSIHYEDSGRIEVRSDSKVVQYINGATYIDTIAGYPTQITGTTGDDIFNSGKYTTAHGGDGNDSFFIKSGPNYHYYGDSGSDKFVFSSAIGPSYAYGGDDDDTFVFQSGSAAVYGGAGADLFQLIGPFSSTRAISIFDFDKSDLIEIGTGFASNFDVLLSKLTAQSGSSYTFRSGSTTLSIATDGHTLSQDHFSFV